MEIEINMTCITDNCPKCGATTEFTEDLGDVSIPGEIEDIPFECECGCSYERTIRLMIGEWRIVEHEGK